MKSYLTAGLAVIGFAALGASAAQASNQATFADYSLGAQAGGSNNVYLVNKSTNSVTSASVFTISNSTAKTAGSANIIFSFQNLGPLVDSVIDQVDAEFTMSATSVVDTTASMTPVGGETIYNEAFDGTFDITYAGATTLHIGDISVTTGETLLEGTFTGLDIDIIEANGTINSLLFVGDNPSGTELTYSSPLLDFANINGVDSSESSSWTASGISGVPGISKGALNSFSASTTGTFSSDPLPLVPGVPEPGAWVLMILGVGGVGAAMRRRRAAKLI